MNDDWLLIAFDSTQQALRAEMLLEYADVDIDTCPTPKSVTAGCALSIQFDAERIEDVKRIIRDERVEIKGIYFKSGDGYATIDE